MAAAATSNAFPGTTESVRAVWESIGETIQAIIRECNLVAGEAMWGVAGESGTARLTVWNRLTRCSSLEVSLQAAEAVLHCDFRTPGRNERWVFHILGDGAGLRRCSRTYSVHDAVNAILDGLCTRHSRRAVSR